MVLCLVLVYFKLMFPYRASVADLYDSIVFAGRWVRYLALFPCRRLLFKKDSCDFLVAFFIPRHHQFYSARSRSNPFIN